MEYSHNSRSRILEKARAIFLKAAKEENVPARSVTRDMFVKHGLGIMSAEPLRKLGGFARIKELLFTDDDATAPPPQGEGQTSAEYIASIIQLCATHLCLPPQEITWYEFAGYIKARWGDNSAGIDRHVITHAGGYNAIRDGAFAPNPNQISIERQRVKEMALFNRRLNTHASKIRYTLDLLFDEYAKSVFRGTIKVAPPVLPEQPVSRILNLVLSDLHFGSDLEAEETGNDYGPVEEARRIASIVKRVARHNLRQRASTKLRVLLLGDIIQNQLHDAEDGAALAEQIARAIHILCQVIGYLAGCFIEVEVDCATGNHGRFTQVHKKRAVRKKWNSVETVIYLSIREKLSAVKNVKFVIPKTPFVVFENFGHKIFATHGDTTFNPGYPGKKIDVGQVETQIQRMNAHLPDRDEYELFITGHVHVASIVNLPSGATLMTNGATTPPDDYAVSLSHFESNPGQWLFESTPDEVVSWSRYLKVGKRDDRDAALEEFVKPWPGM